ncbi:DUF4043 family protein [Caballeronia sp. LZ001]|uniref:phage capsid family protein n=1 Tax=Caballeronia sp. LZ001 TaxID=3038553 RepID=UPI002856D018|nr:DUF4043 family protein [Caballeronia sp. LZ001]MDR5802140.1 DUF4043 family protein [Caballeronia sp. LZ001]
MADTPVQKGLTPTQWDDQFFAEYVRSNQFARYQGTDEGSIIQLKDALQRKAGDSVVFAAVRKLRGSGVRGNEVLEGNEDELDSRSLKVVVQPIRNAVVLTDWDEQRSVIDMRNAAKPALQNWIMELWRNDLISALGQVALNANGLPIPFINATATQRNNWLAANSDRVLFGNSVSNNTGDAAASLATINNTTGKMTAATITLAKRRARLAGSVIGSDGFNRPAIRPYQVKEGANLGQEWYMMFTNSYAFRDLQNDPVMAQANRDARERDVATNPIFTGGDLVYDGVIIREIPELNQYMAAGASGIQVGPSYMCGAQAIGAAWAQRTKSTTDDRDYNFRHGVGVQEIRGMSKLQFGVGINDTDTLVDAGVFTIYTAAVPDA